MFVDTWVSLQRRLTFISQQRATGPVILLSPLKYRAELGTDSAVLFSLQPNLSYYLLNEKTALVFPGPFLASAILQKDIMIYITIVISVEKCILQAAEVQYGV